MVGKMVLAVGAATAAAMVSLTPTDAPSAAPWKGRASPLTSCTLDKGDTIRAVKRIYDLTREPVAMKRDEPDSSSDENANAFYYHLEKYGLWVFFDQNRTVRMIRLDAPFNGKVGGVGIGDSREAMLSRKGKPTEEIAGFNATSWVYYRTADRFVRYEISPINNKVESIMADSCRIPV